MPTSPLSSAQAARQAVATRLQGLMKDAGLSGHELAVRCGWHRAKSSRIARGITPPSDADIRAWCSACGADGQAADIIAASRNAESMYVEWRQIHKDGMRRVHEQTVPLYQRTRSFRVYASNVMPGMLQTAGYATGLLRAITTFQGTPDDVADAVTARLDRSRVIREGDHRFALLLEETVLHYRVCDDAAMREQLDHVLTVMRRPNVALGIIPKQACRTVWPLEAFYAFDDRQVAVETLTAEINLTTPGEIRTYLRAFAELSHVAVRGEPAKRLIRDALSMLG
ncbi:MULTISPECIES: helix-turn-helix transcriptional regulator [unclassified Streptomyces]|uniref:helix-turn-helix domain-containing protein n=1 Tax=unclassified Streptomyces TaxID=2593676 RepID=UPI0029B4BEDB|nr:MULTISPECIES: helix-turn-helix transcriptional regulator [unclassified Streptomyces]MDX3766072.1 helix-turn-helix transcriptional regulator [Streptomyces sp. AK08-01B]MDX3815755.1 helix-turn-helix transcriptional regulator [Streptomyces sp. AK08-01A]